MAHVEIEKIHKFFKGEYTVSDISKLSRIYQHIASPRIGYLMGICCKVHL